ncbi:MAG: sensor domain-containing diguanylate cyclase [Comamonadaceae bacterium]|nr:sensor domain-containing diguanylate cyclase [Comamonadaceae bacterium]
MLYEYVMTAQGGRELLFVGSKCREILELNENDLLDNPKLFGALVMEEDLPRLMAEDETANKEGTPFSSEFRIRTYSGRVKWIQMSSNPNPATDGGVVVWSGVLLAITKRKQMEEQVRQLGFFDQLTNLPNRRLLKDRLVQTLSASDRSGMFGALLVLDLDNFKVLNDTHGHLVGDALLVEAAARLKNCVRLTDTPARFGGDEFVVMLSELSIDENESRKIASQVAEKIRSILAEPFMLTVEHEGQTDVYVQHHCTASIGAVMFRGKAAGLENLIQSADDAMYQAKEGGRNQVRFCAAREDSRKCDVCGKAL